MNDGLKDQQRNAILGVLNQHPKIERAVLFGSRAMGTFTPTSDIDIALYGDLTLRDQARVADKLEQLSIPFTVDLVRMKAVTSPELLAHIKEHGREWKLGGRGKAGERRYIPASEFCASVRDGTHDSPKPVQNGRKLVTSRHLTTGRLDLTDAYLISEEDFEAINKRSKVDRWDVLISMNGTVGEPCLIKEEPDFAIKNIGLFKTKSEADGKWLYYFLRSKDAQQSIREQSRGTTQQYIPLGALRDFPILVADDPEEQKAIAAVLGALDDKIELNRRMNATLQAMARALFQSWFVDFDPVRAKLDGGAPFPLPVGEGKGEGASGLPAALDPTTAALFPEHFAHGEHDMLPVGWGFAAIEEICAINAWTLGKNDDLETLEYVEISEVSRGNIANIATYSRGKEPSRARRRLRHGDTVLSTVRPDRGSYFLALNPPENRVASTCFAVLTPTKVPWSFLHSALTRPEVSDHLGQMADGGAYPAVRPEVLGAMQVALPNEPKILEAFHRLCAPLFEQAEANRAQARTLATLRDALLPKLLSGELSVAADSVIRESRITAADGPSQSGASRTRRENAP